MKSKKILMAMVALGVAACATAAQPPKTSNLGVGDPAPPIAVSKWVQGVPVKNGPGGLRVVEFWATWCGPCKESIPALTKLSQKFKGRVTFVGVDVFERSSDDIATVKKFMKTMGDKMTYNVAVDDKASTMGKTWMEAAHQPGIPTAFVINKAGTVVWIGHPMYGLDAALDQLVAGKYDMVKAKAKFASDMKAMEAEQKAQQDQEKAQADGQAQQQKIGLQVKQAIADYKAGKKDVAFAGLDGVGTTVPQLKPQIGMLKFSLLYSNDKPAAKAFADKFAEDAKDKAPGLLLQLGAAAGMQKDSKPEDKTYALTLADRALKAAPTDPIVEFEASLFYADSNQKDKAISLEQDALKNVSKAKPEYQDSLKKAIQGKLDELTAKPKATPTPAPSAPAAPAAPTKP